MCKSYREKCKVNLEKGAVFTGKSVQNKEMKKVKRLQVCGPNINLLLCQKP